MPRIYAPDAERLYGRVNVTASGCWEYNACRERHGYGRIWYRYTTMMAHRVSYMLSRGPITNDLFVLHKCDNPPCVNPAHLFLGTADDNTKDMITKGRRPIIRTPKLTRQQARYIKGCLLTDTMTRKQLKDKFSISYGAIDAIKHNRNWKDIVMTLYNLKTDGDEWRITKFTNDLDVESSYLLSHTECACPAGHRPVCRHRQMLPTMLAANLCDSGGFYDFEAQQVLLPVTHDSEMGPDAEMNEPILHGAPISQEALNLLHPRPTFTEGTIGITAEELAAEIPTYEEVIAEGHTDLMVSPEAIEEATKDIVDTDKPHPHLPKVDRRI